MDLAVVLEHRFYRTPEGAVWTSTTFAAPFWQRYLEVFDSVRVVDRVVEAPEVPGEWKQANGRVGYLNG